MPMQMLMAPNVVTFSIVSIGGKVKEKPEKESRGFSFLYN